MAAIKQLAGQTIWYGASNIGARFLNYLLTPLITYLLHNPEGVKDYGEFSLIYAWIAVANIVFTYGMETGFFRFSNKEGYNKEAIFQTTFASLLFSTAALVALLIFFRHPINHFLELKDHANYISWCALLIGLDALSAIPFAKLRQENRPRKYAFVKLSGIVINIIFVVLFLVYLPRYLSLHPNSILAGWYAQNTAVGFLILANLFQNFIVFAILFSEWKFFRFKFNASLWKEIFRYSSPMILIGIAAMINEVMDRQMLTTLLPLPAADAKRIVGIYAANTKLAIFVTLFIQAFKMAAEPFFFNKSRDKDATLIYARVMKWFVITMALAFLFTALYLDLWKYFIGTAYRSGLGVVPILLSANICLGIYYNLSIWYKLTDKMQMGLYITLLGAIVTLTGNYFFIPHWGMYAAAWSRLACYSVMMIVAYILGQKYYRVPYNVKKIAAYLCVMMLLFFAHKGVQLLTDQLYIRLLSATICMLLFLLLVLKAEKKELTGLPIIGKYLQQY